MTLNVVVSVDPALLALLTKLADNHKQVLLDAAAKLKLHSDALQAALDAKEK